MKTRLGITILGFVALDESLFLCGGLARINNTSSWPWVYQSACHVYNVQSNTWKTGAKLNVARANVGMVVYEHVLYALGGDDITVGGLDSVEFYDADQELWSIAHMKLAHSGYSSYTAVSIDSKCNGGK